MIIEQITPVASKEPQEQQRLYTVATAARILGLTESALRAQIFRSRVRVIRLGTRTFVTADELDRLSGRAI